MEGAAAEAPWAADRPLDEARARAAVEDQFPDLCGAAFEFLGSGWDHDAWAAGGWVFRFPRRSAVAGDLAREAAALDLAAEALAPRGLRVPRVERRGRPGPHFPYPFSGARRLAGVSGDRWRGEPGGALARELGAALAALHAVPEARARSADLRDEHRSVARHLPALARHADVLRAALPADLRTLAEPHLRGEVAPPPAYAGPARFVHADLTDEHVLVDPDTGRATALIDFGDAALGDPALDLAGLLLWLGPGHADALLGAYAPRPDPDLVARLPFLARTLALLWLGGETRRHGAPPRPHLARVRRAFRLPAGLG